LGLEIAGIAGMLLIIAGWLISYKAVPDLRLSALYCAGSALLAYHAFSLGDVVFLVLNTLAVAISFINVVRAARRKG